MSETSSSVCDSMEVTEADADQSSDADESSDAMDVSECPYCNIHLCCLVCRHCNFSFSVSAVERSLYFFWSYVLVVLSAVSSVNAVIQCFW